MGVIGAELVGAANAAPAACLASDVCPIQRQIKIGLVRQGGREVRRSVFPARVRTWIKDKS